MKNKLLKKICVAAVAVLLLDTSVTASAYYIDNTVTITTNKNNDGSVTYTNKANGKTYTKFADGTSAGDADYNIRSENIKTKETIEIGEYSEIKITLPYGQASISKLKVKKGKDKVSAKICKSKKVTGETPYRSYDSATKKYFIRNNVTGERIYEGDSRYNESVDYAEYTIRLYGKKLGKATLSFNINDKNGKKISEKKINVTVKNTASAIVSATFGGKSLIKDYSKNGNNKKYIYYDGTRDGNYFTTKKSGKFKVKLNNNYRLKAIYVKKSNGEESKPVSSNIYESGSSLEYIRRPVDLNGDGDCNDVIDGVEESQISIYNYKKIKNGQKVTLSSVPNYSEDTNLYDQDTNYSWNINGKSNMSDTTFIVIYQDKRTGVYYSWTTVISRRIAK